LSRRGWQALGALFAVLLGALCVYLYLKATPYQEVVDHGASPEARANPYLAAEQFLRKQGLAVTHANSLDVLPGIDPRQHSLLLLGDRSTMTPRQIDQVLNWTRAGGRLLFVAESLWDEKTGQSNDVLLDRVQLHQILSKDLKDPPPDPIDDPYPKLTKLYLEDEDAPAYVSFDTEFHLEDPKNLAQSWANSGKATHMMQLDHGLGSITVADFQQLWLAAVAMSIRAAIAVYFQGQAMHRVAAAAKTLQVTIFLLDDLADLGAPLAYLEGHETIDGEACVQSAIGVVTRQQPFLGEVDRAAREDASVPLHHQAAEPGVHQQMPDHHETAAVELAVQRAVGIETDQQTDMIGQFEMMIGQQQDSTVLLHADIAGFGARHAWWQPVVTKAPGQVAG